MVELSASETRIVAEFRRCYTGACSFTACDIQFVILKRHFHSDICVEVGKTGLFFHLKTKHISHESVRSQRYDVCSQFALNRASNLAANYKVKSNQNILFHLNNEKFTIIECIKL